MVTELGSCVTSIRPFGGIVGSLTEDSPARRRSGGKTNRRVKVGCKRHFHIAPRRKVVSSAFSALNYQSRGNVKSHKSIHKTM